MFSSPSLSNCSPKPAGTLQHPIAQFQQQQTSASAFRWNFMMPSRQEDALEFASDHEVDTRRSLKMAKVEAVLFVADSALSTRKISQLATLANATEAKELIDKLNAALTATNSSFHIKRVATGYQMMTQPQYAFWLNKLHQRQAALKLSPPALETLAMVVYRQPITRADIESIRGVQSAEMLKQLMERGLVRINGKDDSLGRPFLYESTRKFLEIFGLKSLDDLPMGETLRIRPQQKSKPVEESPDSNSVPDLSAEEEIQTEDEAETESETDYDDSEDITAA